MNLTNDQQELLDKFWARREVPCEASEYNHISNAVLSGDSQLAQDRYKEWCKKELMAENA